MFRMRLTVNTDLLTRLRELPMRAQRNLRTSLQTDLKPDLQRDTDALFAEPPGPSPVGFEFGTPKSRAYYFWLISTFPQLTDPESRHWIRMGDLADAFEVRISDKLRENLIVVSNLRQKSTGTMPYPARFVYGAWAPPGHINTGWQGQADAARQTLQGKATEKIYKLWAKAVSEAKRGRG